MDYKFNIHFGTNMTKRIYLPEPPSHFIKQQTIANYQKQNNCNILVETGTYLGDMITAQLYRFKTIISIELGEELFKQAKTKFVNHKHVNLYQGDSGKVLNQIMQQNIITEQAIFWLDGHYSAGITAKGELECPIIAELDAIFDNNKYDHIILIDDARCFGVNKDFPTIDAIKEYVKNKNSKYNVEVFDDIIRCAKSN